ncbi:MAG TPA: hypothetical protein VED40_11375 [Azospirillaceae bacterium]|nr:hypothetical protein [Azospirillaceae bacterium]
MSGRTAKANMATRRRANLIRDAERLGLLGAEGPPLIVRVPALLLQAAKKRSGIKSDTELLTYALAKVALEDVFLDALTANQGTVPDHFFGEDMLERG